MKKFFSIVLTIAMAVSCLAIFPNAATIKSDVVSGGDVDEHYFTLDYAFNEDNTKFTITMGSYTISNNTKILENYCVGYFLYNTDDLAYIEDSYVTTGQIDENCIQPFEAYSDDALGYVRQGVSGGIIETSQTPGVQTVCTLSWTFDVLAAPGEVIEIWEDGSEGGCTTYFGWNDYYYYGNEEPLFTVTVPAAEVEPEYTAPATPVAQAKAACEACGTEAGVRFLMTVDKTAADFEDVTAYGVVISTADGEYKYTVDADTKMAETDTEIQYAVVVTGAPAGTVFTATAFLTYGDKEVAGVSGEYNA